METKKVLTTRRALIAGLASTGGLMLAGCSKELPPTYGNVLRMGDLLTYKAHRLLLPAHTLAKEYDRHDISSMPAIGTTNPADSQQPFFNADLGAAYERLRVGDFAEWRLSIEGRVARPGTYTLTELKRFASRTQITKHTCEEGWSYIAEWTGVRLSSVLAMVEPRAEARYVVFVPYANPNQRTGLVRALWDSLDMADVLHPQTLLAYGMNGQEIPTDHGAPVRLRVARQLGYKNTKYLARLIVTDSMNGFGKRAGSRSAEGGNAWYGGI